MTATPGTRLMVARVVALSLLALALSLSRMAQTGAPLVDCESATSETMTGSYEPEVLTTLLQPTDGGATRWPAFWSEQRALTGHVFSEHLNPDCYIDIGFRVIRTEEDLFAVLAEGAEGGVCGDEPLAQARSDGSRLLVAAVLSRHLANGAQEPIGDTGLSVLWLMRTALCDGDVDEILSLAETLRSYLASGADVAIERCGCAPQEEQQDRVGPDTLSSGTSGDSPDATAEESEGGKTPEPPAVEESPGPVSEPTTAMPETTEP